MRAEANKLYTNFSKGLITEASPLAYPEGATLDELNCEMDSNNDRIRRWGHDTNGTMTPVTAPSAANNTRVYTHLWRSVANKDELSFLVNAVDGVIHFYQSTGPSTFTKKSFILVLNDYKIPSATLANLSSSFCAFTHGKGELFVTNRFTDPLRVVYNPSTDTITVTPIKIKIRDFVGIDDGLAVDQEPTTLTKEHHYNLKNQGWVNPENTGTGTNITSVSLFGDLITMPFPTTTGPIQTYFTAVGRYPGNNKVWWTGKDAEGIFKPDQLQKIFFGNTRAARGHYILEAFRKDRTAVSGIASIPVEEKLTRPEAICFTSGRVFFGHESTVFLSPTLSETSKVGDCFQEADPTAEDISDLIPSDGGYIEIPDADKIICLKPLSDGVVVLATNGVWFIQSGSKGFTATDYALNKVSEIGVEGAESVVVADSLLFWWSRVGIQALSQSNGQFGPVPGAFDKQNITEDTIKTFFNEIPTAYRDGVKGIFDPATNSVYWLYQVDNTRKRRLLVYHLKNSAFIPWEINNQGSYPISMFINKVFAANTRLPTFLEFLSREELRTNTGSSVVIVPRITLTNFVDRTYRDYQTASLSGEGAWPSNSYPSYIETGYEVLEDGLRKKQVPFLGVFFRRTEEVLIESTDAVLQYPSSCFMTVKWSWAGRESSNKWSPPVQVYRPSSSPFFNSSTDLTNRTEYDIIYSRNKVRGSGRAIQFRFSEDRAGYGFTLIGWHSFFQAKVTP